METGGKLEFIFLFRNQFKSWPGEREVEKGQDPEDQAETLLNTKYQQTRSEMVLVGSAVITTLFHYGWGVLS